MLPAFEYGPDAASWYAVNDSVMGGISNGGAVMMKTPGVRFAGILSLENNGGFSSIRSDGEAYKIEKGKDLLLTVKGDGRTYYFDLRTNVRQRAFTYRQSFQTKAGEVQKVRLPLAGFYATSFGRRVPQVEALDPSEVKSIGITISDKKAGPFRLDILNVELINEEASVPKTVDEVLRMAIQRGVPFYNRGDADACAALYEIALSGLLFLPKEQLDEEQRRMITSTLQAGATAATADDKAWTFRRGIDQILK